MKNYIKQKNSLQKGNFLTVNSINVVVKDDILFDLNLKSLERVLKSFPSTFLKGVDYIMFGNFDFLRKKNYNASYMDGVIYVLNHQGDNHDILDDIVHEVGHAVEEQQHDFIYGDGVIEQEFLKKRKYLNLEFQKESIAIPDEIMQNPEYNENLDKFFSEEIGYANMMSMSNGIFYSPYGATSLREYFANGFEAFYYHKDLYLKKVSPVLFSKLEDLETGEFYEI